MAKCIFFESHTASLSPTHLNGEAYTEDDGLYTEVHCKDCSSKIVVDLFAARELGDSSVKSLATWNEWEGKDEYVNRSKAGEVLLIKSNIEDGKRGNTFSWIEN